MLLSYKDKSGTLPTNAMVIDPFGFAGMKRQKQFSVKRNTVWITHLTGFVLADLYIFVIHLTKFGSATFHVYKKTTRLSGNTAADRPCPAQVLQEAGEEGQVRQEKSDEEVQEVLRLVLSAARSKRAQ